MKLIFVYNAKAGLLNGLMDSIHKTVSPETYECDLCAITYGFFTMNKAWRAYLIALPIETRFFYQQDFLEAYPDHATTMLPVIALDRGGHLDIVLDAPSFRAIRSVYGLMSALDEALYTKSPEQS
jgi:hypothetical protein